ncbi:MAG: enoyl-CoA hydratase-related protein [Phycisphaerales bacterium]
MADAATDSLLVADDGHVRTITLNRPDVFNAFDDALTMDMQKALKDAARDANVRVLILTGNGRAFSSGQDLGDLKDRYVPGYVPEYRKDLLKRYNPIIEQLAGMDKPVIAAVNGVAAGAGCSLALACDMRIASEHASFIEAFVNVGLIPDSGSTWFLPRLVGMARAFELCCTGRKVGAEEAERIGLVNRVVPADDLLTVATTEATRLASLPPRAIALTKRLLLQGATRPLGDQLDAEGWAQDTAGRTADHMEGMTAFLEKRAPEFTGA